MPHPFRRPLRNGADVRIEPRLQILKTSSGTPMRLLFGLICHAAVAASISTAFEGGCLGRIQKLSETHFRLSAKGETDQDGRNRQANWYYFRVDDAPLQEITFDIVDLSGEYNYKPNRGAITKDTPPVISYDGKQWRHIQSFEYDSAEPRLRLRVHPQARRFWIAHTPPYTNETLARLRADIAHLPDFREELIGRTVNGRDLLLWTISDRGTADKETIWLMFRQHSWETGSSWTGEGAVRALLADTPAARALRRGFVWKIFPLCDPDGVARGGVRFNAKGYDLNRNWDVADPLRMPEISAQRNAVKHWMNSGHSIDLFLSLHNTETSEYLEGPPEDGGHGKFHALAEHLYTELEERTSFSPTRPLFYAGTTTTAGMQGRMVVIQGLYRDFQLPGFLMEQRISFNPKMGQRPEISDRVQFGGELVRAIAAAVVR